MLRVVYSSPSSIRLGIHGLADAALVAKTRCIIEGVFAGVPGDWTVALAAADTRARWDVAVRGPRGIHVFSFPGTATRVPELMSEYLSRILPRLVPEETKPI
jgi:hypothetical protein